MRVLVFDHSREGGHSFNYHRLLLPALAPLADSLVVVVREDVLEEPSTQIQLRDMPREIKWAPDISPTTGSHLRQNLAVRRALVAAVRRHRPHHLFVPTADSLSQVMGLAAALGRRDFPPSLEAEAALHRCGFAYPAPSWRKHLFYRFGYWTHTRAPWTRLFNVDIVAYDWIQKHGGSIAHRNELLPDPVERVTEIDRHEARRRFSLPPDGVLIGCVGVLDARKGTDLLLAAFRRTRFASPTRVFLAGQHSEQIRALLKAEYNDLVRSGVVISVDRFLDVGELGNAIAAMDLVCTPYARPIAIASIALRAAAANRPVLAANTGWCGRMVPAFQLGWTCNVLDPTEFANAMVVAVENAAHWQRSPALKSLVEFHSPENFAATFTSRLRERLDLPPDPRMIRWDSVERASRLSHDARPTPVRQ